MSSAATNCLRFSLEGQLDQGLVPVRSRRPSARSSCATPPAPRRALWNHQHSSELNNTGASPLDRVDGVSATNHEEASQMPARPQSITVAPIETVGAGRELGRATDQLCINTIRTLAMDAVQQANSGHPGTPMALAPVVYTLWQTFSALRSRRSDLAQSRSLRAFQRPCLDAALCDAASQRREGASTPNTSVSASPRSRSTTSSGFGSSAANVPAIPNIT